MKHKIDIWAKNKETNGFYIAGKIEIDEDDIEDLALNNI